jgi:carotenoid cleavage dioxygenase-like enzyme
MRRGAWLPFRRCFAVTAVYRDDEKRSDLLVLDAENVEAEPPATVRLPHRIPFGFHGNCRPDRT